MRTTVEIDDEVLSALRRKANDQGATLGQVISELARRSLAAEGQPKIRNGVRLFAPKKSNVKPNLRLVNQLRDET